MTIQPTWPTETLVSANGSQFTFEIFQLFRSSCCITIIRSPQYNPQSNGQAECFEDALLEGKEEGTRTGKILNSFLLSYRTTLNATVKNEMSPAKALMGRKFWAPMDALRPQKRKERQDPSQNKKKATFTVGTPLFTGNYRPEQPNWIPSTIHTKKDYLWRESW